MTIMMIVVMGMRMVLVMMMDSCCSLARCFLLSEIRGGRAAVAAYWSDGKLGDDDDYGEGGGDEDSDGDGDRGDDEDGVVVSQKNMIDLQIDPWPQILAVHWFPANMVNCIERW